MRRALLLLLTSLVLPASAGAAPPPVSGPPQPQVVVLRDDVPDVGSAVGRLQRLGGFTADRTYGSALKGFAARLNDQQRDALLRDPAVEAVVADTTFTGDGQVALAAGELAPAGIRRIGAATATTAAGAGAAVAVLDTGIDLRSPDLVARHGVNCVSSATPAQDDNGHGTHIAGTIAAANTGSGVVGAAPGTVVYAVKVLNARKTGTLSQLLCGIDWVTRNAAALNIRVANMSLSGSGVDDGRCGEGNGDAQHKAICASTRAGVTYVVTAGNSGRDLASTIPASYREVLTVTAMNDADGRPGALGGTFACKTTEKDDRFATYSNFATTTLAAEHVVAGPGTCVVSTKLGGGTVAMTGTSMAAPHVAGVVSSCTAAGRSCAGLAPADVIRRVRTLAAATPGRGFAGDPQAPVTGRIYGNLPDASAP